MPIRCVSIEAAPSMDAQLDGQASSAYVNVYVQCDTDAEALDAAGRELKEAGWAATDEANVSIVDESSFEVESQGRAYFRQCEQDGIVVVFHCWRDEH